MNEVRKLETLIKKACEPLQGMPVALSGGIDSGLLASLIKPEFAITVELPGGKKYDEFEKTKKVAKHLDITLDVVEPVPETFDETMKIAVKAIGKPIPHFNIFPLFVMYKWLKLRGVKDVVVGDGPDESMCGYTRHLIMNYLYEEPKHIKAFKHYQELLKDLEPNLYGEYMDIIGIDEYYSEGRKYWKHESLLDNMCAIDMKYKREEMNDMSDGIAKHFGIKIHRPYESKEVDGFMFNLPPHLKIFNNYGKYALRMIAEKYLPKEITWNKHKKGGPVYPVNIFKKWMDDGEFSKKKYIKYQEKILK